MKSHSDLEKGQGHQTLSTYSVFNFSKCCFIHADLLLCFYCLTDVLLLAIPHGAAECVIVVFPDHTHLLFS